MFIEIIKPLTSMTSTAEHSHMCLHVTESFIQEFHFKKADSSNNETTKVFMSESLNLKDLIGNLFSKLNIFIF